MPIDGGLRGIYNGSRFAHLDWSEFNQRPIEVVAAAGHCNNLEIWRVCYGLEQGSFEELRKKLLKALSSRYPREPRADQIADQALHEYLSPNCLRCRTSDKFIVGQPLVCPRCGGSGVEKFTDERRASMMKVSCETAKVIAHKITWLLGWLGSQDRKVNTNVSTSLGRSKQ